MPRGLQTCNNYNYNKSDQSMRLARALAAAIKVIIIPITSADINNRVEVELIGSYSPTFVKPTSNDNVKCNDQRLTFIGDWKHKKIPLKCPD